MSAFAFAFAFAFALIGLEIACSFFGH